MSYGPSAFCEALVCDRAALAGLRGRVGEWLRGHGLVEAAVVDVVLAMHEAAANAIEHSRGGARVSVCVADLVDGVLVEVRNDGGWIPPQVANDERGRGLMIIRSLASSAEVLARADEVVVHEWFDLTDPVQGLGRSVVVQPYRPEMTGR